MKRKKYILKKHRHDLHPILCNISGRLFSFPFFPFLGFFVAFIYCVQLPFVERKPGRTWAQLVRSLLLLFGCCRWDNVRPIAQLDLDRARTRTMTRIRERKIERKKGIRQTHKEMAIIVAWLPAEGRTVGSCTTHKYMNISKWPFGHCFHCVRCITKGLQRWARCPVNAASSVCHTHTPITTPAIIGNPVGSWTGLPFWDTQRTVVVVFVVVVVFIFKGCILTEDWMSWDYGFVETNDI